MLADVLSTVFALLSAAAAAFFAWSAREGAEDAGESRRELEGQVRAFKAAIDRISSVEGRLDRLAGRVYAQARKPQPVDDELPELVERGNGVLDPELAAELALQRAPAVSPGLKQR